MYIYICVYMYICVCVYIYIYIYKPLLMKISLGSTSLTMAKTGLRWQPSQTSLCRHLEVSISVTMTQYLLSIETELKDKNKRKPYSRQNQTRTPRNSRGSRLSPTIQVFQEQTRDNSASHPLATQREHLPISQRRINICHYLRRCQVVSIT